jgi:hypothetical protein
MKSFATFLVLAFITGSAWAEANAPRPKMQDGKILLVQNTCPGCSGASTTVSIDVPARPHAFKPVTPRTIGASDNSAGDAYLMSASSQTLLVGERSLRFRAWYDSVL